MNFVEFRRELQSVPFFSVQDIKKIRGKVYHHRLVEWQKKGLVERIANGVYKFSDVDLDELKLFFIANKIYSPSYISLETALAFYNFIPESSYNFTSVTTRKTSYFNTKYGKFFYRKIKNSLFFGYNLQKKDNFYFKIAEPEKAIIDFLYFHSELTDEVKISEVRFNNSHIKETIDFQKFNKYLDIYNNKSLTKRANQFLRVLDVNT